MNESVKQNENIYDVKSYSDNELYDILDLTNPSDRELEAKILLLIDKYSSESNTELKTFFEDIYNHFFEESDVDNSLIEESDEDIDEIEDKTNNIILSELNNANYLDTSKDRYDKVITYSKDLEHASGQLNPLLQQTVQRVITIDSQYRPDKRTPPTDFTINLSEPLKDIVSIKLYSVEIPYTWWTIKDGFGSNFYILKGNVPGIDNGNHDYQIEITPGNYSPSELALELNESITKLKNVHTDVSFGATSIDYNKYNSKITTTTEIYKQYNEMSYTLNFPGWTTPDPVNDINYFPNRILSIPSFLGFKNPSYSFFKLDGMNELPLTTSQDTNTKYLLRSTNNFFTVEKFIRVPNSTEEIIDKTIIVTLTLPINVSYTRLSLFLNLQEVILNNEFLSIESGIRRINKENNSYFELKIKPNRNTTNNLPNSKIRIKFPTEEITVLTPQKIWTGMSSSFKFTDLNTVINDIRSEISPLTQQSDQFTVTTSPYIHIKSIVTGYDVSINDYKIDIPNTDISYNVTTYLDAINNRLVDLSMGEISSLSNMSIDLSGRCKLQLDILRTINSDKYRLDLSESILNSVLGFESANLVNGTNTFTSTIPLQNSYTTQTNKILTVSAKNDDNYVSSSLKYELLLEDTGVIGSGRLFQEINNQLNTFTDSYGEYIFAGSSLDVVVINNSETNKRDIELTLNINVNKQLSEDGYSVQFLEDVSYNISNSEFQLEQGILNVGDENVPVLKYNLFTGKEHLSTVTHENLNVGIMRNKGFLGSDNLIVLTNNTLEYTIDIVGMNNYVIDADYLMYISVASMHTITPDYGRSANHTSSNPYGYLIPSPSTLTYNDLDSLAVALQNQILLFSDLTGSTITIENNENTTATIKLNLVINQSYYFDSWNKHLNIDYAMIDNSFPLLNSNIPSVYDINREYTDISYSFTDELGRTALGIKNNSRISQNLITLNDSTNKIELLPFEEGVIADENKLIIELPIREGSENIRYTRDMLLNSINNALIGTVGEESIINVITEEGIEYVDFNITINKEYRAKDYRISFFDEYSFSKCSIGVNSIQNTTWDTTLGWILGYREYTIYNLSNYISDNHVISIVADTGISTELFNYFLLCIDDYNQSHLNDGLVTITTRDTEQPLPSYATRTNFICDPATGEKIYNTEVRKDNNKLTEKQIASLVSKVNTSSSETNLLTGNVSSKVYGSTPFVSDVFGVIPMKLSGLTNGQSVVEFGGTLQNQERQYFGPVNLKRMSIKLVSDRGNIVDLNNANWSFSLICEQLYKPSQNPI